MSDQPVKTAAPGMLIAFEEAGAVVDMLQPGGWVRHTVPAGGDTFRFGSPEFPYEVIVAVERRSKLAAVFAPLRRWPRPPTPLLRRQRRRIARRILHAQARSLRRQARRVGKHA